MTQKYNTFTIYWNIPYFRHIHLIFDKKQTDFIQQYIELPYHLVNVLHIPYYFEHLKNH